MNAQLRHTRQKGQHDGDEEFDARIGAMQPSVACHMLQVGIHQRSSLSHSSLAIFNNTWVADTGPRDFVAAAPVARAIVALSCDLSIGPYCTI